MAGLTARDLRLVLEVARELGHARDPTMLREQVLPQLKRIVPCDLVSYNEIEPGAEATARADPPQTLFAGAEEILAHHAHQNPLIAHYARGPDARALKFSDFLTLRQLHRLEIYDLLYRPVGVQYQLAFVIPAPPGRVVGFALNRERRDFSERDREVIEAVRPFLVQAYHDALRRASLEEGLLARELSAELSKLALIVLRADGSISYLTDAAARYLRSLGPRPHGGLPEPLASWTQGQRHRATALDEQAAPTEPLVLPEMTVRLVHSGRGSLDALVLEPRTPTLGDTPPRSLDLTPREEEILRLLTLGLSNTQISQELAISERTVQKHLEHLYAKLHVNSRTAAIAVASKTTDQQ